MVLHVYTWEYHQRREVVAASINCANYSCESPSLSWCDTTNLFLSYFCPMLVLFFIWYITIGVSWASCSTYPNQWMINLPQYGVLNNFDHWTKIKKIYTTKLCHLVIWSLLDICWTIKESCFTSVITVLHNIFQNFEFTSVIFRFFVATILPRAFLYFLVCLHLHEANGIITRSSKQNKDKRVLK